MLLFAIGQAASYTSVGIGGTAGVPYVDPGIAGGLLNTSKQVGGSIGLAVLSVVATHGGEGHQQTAGALVEGVNDAFLVILGFTALAVVPAAAMIGGQPGRHRRPRLPDSG